MTFTFRPAVRESVGLWINLIAGTGGGKTFSGMRLASGISAGKPFAVIDTENRRALHYADQFKFDHAELRPPFRPSAYADAIVDADKAGYPVIMLDSGSHVWAGDGGVLDWQDEELDEMVKRAKARGDNRSEWQIRESGKMSAWIKPKMGHKQMVQKMLQVKAHLILCLRAEQKIEMVKDEEGKMKIQAKQSLTGLDGWIPVCDKNLPFEATCSFLLLASKPGVPHPIKLQEQHKSLFPLDAPINEQSGQRLAQWAAGTKSTAAQKSEAATPGPSALHSVADGSPSAPLSFITPDQAIHLEDRAREIGLTKESLCKAAKVERLSQIEAQDYKRAVAWLDKHAEKLADSTQP